VHGNHKGSATESPHRRQRPYKFECERNNRSAAQRREPAVVCQVSRRPALKIDASQSAPIGQRKETTAAVVHRQSGHIIVSAAHLKMFVFAPRQIEQMHSIRTANNRRTASFSSAAAAAITTAAPTSPSGRIGRGYGRRNQTQRKRAVQPTAKALPRASGDHMCQADGRDWAWGRPVRCQFAGRANPPHGTVLHGDNEHSAITATAMPNGEATELGAAMVVTVSVRRFRQRTL
jgi:hypothetical protein